MTPASVLSIRNLSVSYGAQPALESISLQVNAGEVLGLLGPNGAGKTTLLRAVIGKIRVRDGEIWVQGCRLRPGQAHKHSIGFVPQSLGLYRHLTAGENLDVFARFAGVPRRERQQRILWALQEVSLAHRAKDLVRSLSGGMQRRLHLAIGLITRPALLVLDEPTAGVDMEARASLHEFIRKQASAGSAVVLVTHELTEAEDVCDRVALINEGQLVAVDTPEQLVRLAFGEEQLYCVRTAERLPQAQADALSSVGLARVDITGRWCLYSSLPAEEFLSELHRALRGELHWVREFAVRRPGLDAVMRRLVKTDLQQPRELMV